MEKSKHYLNTSDGVSIITVLVTLSVTMILAVAGFQRITKGLHESGHFKSKSSLTTLKSYVRDSFNCQKTVAEAGAFINGNSYKIMSDRPPPNDVLIKAVSSEDPSYTKIGRFSLRATSVTCDTCPNNKKLLIEAAAVDDAGNFVKDSLTKKEIGWTDLFEKEPPLACTLP